MKNCLDLFKKTVNYERMSSRKPHNTETIAVQFPYTPEGRRAWIKSALAVRGWTFGRIAKELGVARSTPRNALWRSSPRMEREIAARLDLTPEAIWPERYETRAARRGGAR